MRRSFLGHMQTPQLGMKLASVRTLTADKSKAAALTSLYRQWPGPNQEVQTDTADYLGDSSSQAELSF